LEIAQGFYQSDNFLVQLIFFSSGGDMSAEEKIKQKTDRAKSLTDAEERLQSDEKFLELKKEESPLIKSFDESLSSDVTGSNRRRPSLSGSEGKSDTSTSPDVTASKKVRNEIRVRTKVYTRMFQLPSNETLIEGDVLI
jgi:hypothetical protein